MVDDEATDRLRIQLGFRLISLGLIITAALIVILAKSATMTADTVVALAGVFTTVFGTVIAAYFGYQSGAAGKEKERKLRNRAEFKLADAFVELDPTQRAKLRQRWQTLNLEP